MNRWEPLEDPEFVRVQSLVVLNGKKFLICEKLTLIEYSVAMGGFLTERSDELLLLTVNDLKYCFPQIAHHYRGYTGVIMQGTDDIFMI